MEAVATLRDIQGAQGDWNDIGAWGRACRVRAAMLVADLGKSALAERLDLSDNTVGAWASGDKDPDWSRWISIAYACGLDEFWVPTAALLARAEQEVAALRPGLKSEPRLPVRKKDAKGDRAEKSAPKKKARG